MPRIADERVWDRFCPSASISSRNSTTGALRRASWNSSCTFFSLLPIHMSRTSDIPTEMNLAPISPATARATKVLPQPGGP